MSDKNASKSTGILRQDLKLFAGNAHPVLARKIAEYIGTGLADIEVGRFPDGETKVQIREDVRGRDCFIIQPTSPPVNDHLMELLIIMDALRRASAARITAVVPYFGYARQDRKDQGRVPITAKLAANLLTEAGANRVICMDLHATQIQGFFDIPVDHLYARPALTDYVKSLKIDDPVVLSPDPGGMKLAGSFARRLGGQIAVIEKRRTGDSEVEKGHVVGDIRGKNTLIVDDMISTAGSISQAVHTAVEFGAKSIRVLITHPVFCGRAFERLKGLPVEELCVCDTIPIKKEPENINITVLGVGPILAEAILRTHKNESISKLFS